MLNLQEVKAAVDHLSPDERAELRAYLDQGEVRVLRAGTMDVDALLEAARQIREGFTDEEWEEVERAMNEEYIEPVDDDGFPLL
ncbi:MAG: hypothetical protein IPK19_15230 [Chloroflexi bacterium]|nr:hypothetical protein [Chloroflexota bacterium]